MPINKKWKTNFSRFLASIISCIHELSFGILEIFDVSVSFSCQKEISQISVIERVQNSCRLIQLNDLNCLFQVSGVPIRPLSIVGLIEPSGDEILSGAEPRELLRLASFVSDTAAFALKWTATILPSATWYQKFCNFYHFSSSFRSSYRPGSSRGRLRSRPAGRCRRASARQTARPRRWRGSRSRRSRGCGSRRGGIGSSWLALSGLARCSRPLWCGRWGLLEFSFLVIWKAVWYQILMVESTEHVAM